MCESTVMAIDLSEPLIALAEVPAQRFMPRRRQGRKLNVATVYRWAQQGVRGVRLEVVRVGGTLCTSRAALLDFFRRAAANGNGGHPAETPSDERRQQA